MESGTKTRPRPSPCTTPETTIGRASIWIEKPVICQSEKAVSDRPARISSRASTLPTSRPTTIIEIIVPTPRGASTMPVVTTG